MHRKTAKSSISTSSSHNIIENNLYGMYTCVLYNPTGSFMKAVNLYLQVFFVHPHPTRANNLTHA